MKHTDDNRSAGADQKERVSMRQPAARPGGLGDCSRKGYEILDAALGRMRRGRVALAMELMIPALRHLRDHCDAQSWHGFANVDCRLHPIAEYLLQDPFTRRSFMKPRGYPGDAETLDLLHAGELPEGTSDVGAEIFGLTTTGSAPASIRARVALTAAKIDAMAEERLTLRVLAVMAGHLWEAGRSRATAEGAVEKYLAFDQDARSLAAVESAAYGPGVTTYHGALRPLLAGRSVFRNFDLVYSWLHDNLPDAAARTFTGALFDSVAPGGTLLIGNLAPELLDIGYMEAFMDWHLVYRNESQLLALTDALDGSLIAATRSYRDPHGNIVMLEVERGA